MAKAMTVTAASQRIDLFMHQLYSGARVYSRRRFDIILPVNLSSVITLLKKNANPKNVAGMARFGINPKNTLGISVPFLRSLAKKIGKDHKLAAQLWRTKIHEARLLAGFIDDPKLVTAEQMDSWVKDLDSWDVCDQVCSTLFDKTPYAYRKARQWTKSSQEYVRRAGFAMMACLAVHDKKAPDRKLLQFFPLIQKYSTDERNFVKKAVNWALRQIGKRHPTLRKPAILLAKKLANSSSPSARWAGKDALRELVI
jgi:3-methyladenine DNA glycosylase AlkD